MTDKLPRIRYSTNHPHDEQIHALMMQVPAYAALQEQPKLERLVAENT